MTWGYRIIRHPEPREEHGYYLALHEVHYGDDCLVHSWTIEPITFVCGGEDGQEGIIQSIEMALRDARARPVLELTADDKIVPETNIAQLRSPTERS